MRNVTLTPHSPSRLALGRDAGAHLMAATMTPDDLLAVATKIRRGLIPTPAFCGDVAKGLMEIRDNMLGSEHGYRTRRVLLWILPDSPAMTRLMRNLNAKTVRR